MITILESVDINSRIVSYKRKSISSNYLQSKSNLIYRCVTRILIQKSDFSCRGIIFSREMQERVNFKIFHLKSCLNNVFKSFSTLYACNYNSFLSTICKLSR